MKIQFLDEHDVLHAEFEIDAPLTPQEIAAVIEDALSEERLCQCEVCEKWVAEKSTHESNADLFGDECWAERPSDFAASRLQLNAVLPAGVAIAARTLWDVKPLMEIER